MVSMKCISLKKKMVYLFDWRLVSPPQMLINQHWLMDWRRTNDKTITYNIVDNAVWYYMTSPTRTMNRAILPTFICFRQKKSIRSMKRYTFDETIYTRCKYRTRLCVLLQLLLNATNINTRCSHNITDAISIMLFILLYWWLYGLYRASTCIWKINAT